jgi:hypothetical protein
MNLTSDQLTDLANALGLLARGAKTVRKVLLQLANSPQPQTQSVPIEPPPTVKQQTETDSGSESESEDDTEITILDEPFTQQAENYMKHKMRWSDKKGGDAKRYYESMIRGRIRVNKMKSCWVLTGCDPNSRKSWTKTSLTNVKLVYDRIRAGWETIIEIIKSGIQPDGVRNSQWSRRFQVLELQFPEELFSRGGWKHTLFDRHAELPKLK